MLKRFIFISMLLSAQRKLTFNHLLNEHERLLLKCQKGIFGTYGEHST